MNEAFDVERELKGKRKGGTLENWNIVDINSTYGGIRKMAWGNVYDTENFREGTRIHTSEIVAIHEEEKIVETLNSYYILGEQRIIEDEE